MIYTYLNVFCSLLLTVLMVSCSDSGNSSPVITGENVNLSLEKNNSLTLSLSQFNTSDDDADPLTLVVTGDANCTVVGTTITPVWDYVGDLFIQVAVNDGTETSPAITVVISVVEEVTLFPLKIGSWWEYNDVFNGVTTTSIATIGAPVDLDGITYTPLSWNTMGEYGVSFLLYTDTNGVQIAGGIATTDTITGNHLFVPHKAVLNAEWPYSALEFVKTDEQFRYAPEVQVTCSAKDAIVVVPAATFNCVVFEYQYTYTPIRGNSIWGNHTFATSHRAGDIVTEKVYFAPNVGMVKAETLIGVTVVYTKVLTSWSGSTEL